MFEIFRRTYLSPSQRVRRLELNAAVPGEKEGYDPKTVTQEQELWFQSTSSLGYQVPSTVLVERVVEMEPKRGTEMRAKKAGAGNGTDRGSHEQSAGNPKQGDGLGVIRKLELTTEGFFEFLFSSRWEDGCLLRVLKGQVLDDLHLTLLYLEKFHDVVSYTTTAFIHRRRKLQSCIKMAERGKRPHCDDVLVEKVMVEFDVFCPQKRPCPITEEIFTRADALDAVVSARPSLTEVAEESEDEDETLLSADSEENGDESLLDLTDTSGAEEDSGTGKPSAKSRRKKRRRRGHKARASSTSCEKVKESGKSSSAKDVAASRSKQGLKKAASAVKAALKCKHSSSKVSQTSLSQKDKMKAENLKPKTSTPAVSKKSQDKHPTEKEDHKASKAKSGKQKHPGKQKSVTKVISSATHIESDTEAKVPEDKQVRKSKSGKKKRKRRSKSKTAALATAEELDILNVPPEEIPTEKQEKKVIPRISSFNVKAFMDPILPPSPPESRVTLTTAVDVMKSVKCLNVKFGAKDSNEVQSFAEHYMKPTTPCRHYYVTSPQDSPQRSARGSVVDLQPAPSMLRSALRDPSGVTEIYAEDNKEPRSSHTISKQPSVVVSILDATDQMGPNDSTIPPLPEVKCNIRGFARPWPRHKNCLTSYHRLREPFLQRRVRQQSAFPDLKLPEPPDAAKLPNFDWSDLWQDDFNLGPRDLDNADLMASVPNLTIYAMPGEDSNQTKYKSPFYNQRVGIENEEEHKKKKQLAEKKQKDDRKTASTPGSQKAKNPSQVRKKPRKKDGDDNSDYGDAKPNSWVDRDREKRHGADLDRMAHELVATESAPKTLVNIKTRLKQELRSRQSRRKPLPCRGIAAKPKGALTPHVASAPSESGAQQPNDTTPRATSAADDSFPTESDSSARRKRFMRMWGKDQQFDRFFYRLQGVNEEHIPDLIERQRRLAMEKQNPVKGDTEAAEACDVQVEHDSEDSAATSSEACTDKTSETHSTEKGTEEPSKGKHDVKGSNENVAEKASSESVASKTRKKQISVETILEKPEDEETAEETKAILKGGPGDSSDFIEKMKEGCMLWIKKKQSPMSTSAVTTSGTRLLTTREGVVVETYGWSISDKDPWHIAVDVSNLTGEVALGPQSRRQKVLKLLAEGKIILKLNEARIWSWLRHVPKVIKAGCRDQDGSAATRNDDIALSQEPPVSAAVARFTGVKKNASLKDSSVCHDPKRKNTQPRFPTDRSLPKEAKSQKQLAQENVVALTKEEVTPPPNELTPYIDDAEISNNVTEQELADIMELNKNFNLLKLKSTYSFENLFVSFHPGPIPNFEKRLSLYQHPKTKKKVKAAKKNELAHRKKDQSKVILSEDTMLADMKEEDSETRVLGWLKQFEFLKHKDYMTSPVAVEKIRPAASREHLVECLQLAMQMFVVRKERASTTRPFKTQMSITFTRRAPGQVDVQKMDMVNAAARGLAEEDQSRSEITISRINLDEKAATLSHIKACGSVSGPAAHFRPIEKGHILEPSLPRLAASYP